MDLTPREAVLYGKVVDEAQNSDCSDFAGGSNTSLALDERCYTYHYKDT
jgi:hypothetical protein